MAKKFNLTELMSSRSLESAREESGQQETAFPQDRQEKMMMIDVYNLIPSKDNFYRVDDSLKSSIELIGVLQPLLVSEAENGKYRVIAGHRRRLAVLALVEEGKEERRFMPCVLKKIPVKDRLAIIMANRFREKTDWEKMIEAVEAEELAKELKKDYQLEGRTREVLAEITGISEGQLGRYKAIYKNLEKGLMTAFKDNKIGFSVAAELCGLEKETQKQAEELLEANGVLSMVDVKDLKKQQEEAAQITGQMSIEEGQQAEEEQEGQQEEETEKNVEELMNEPEEYEEPQPETVDSLCYSCNNYENCHEKKRTVTSCNAYINRTEAQKTDEQRYSEEQDKIDRETKKRLREMDDEERMNNIPGKGQTGKKYLRAAGSLFERIMNGEQNFMILKNEGYKKGEKITVGEFSDGKETGRTLEIIISHMEDDKTSSAIGDGYCVINAIMSPALNSLESKKQEIHEEPEEVQEQTPLPVLKNNEQRKEWLNKYQEWGLWYEDGNIGAKYYRYCFENGAELIVEEYQDHSEYAGDYTSSYFHLIGGPEAPRKSHGLCGWQRHDKYKKFPNSETELVEFLKFVQKGDK